MQRLCGVKSGWPGRCPAMTRLRSRALAQRGDLFLFVGVVGLQPAVILETDLREQAELAFDKIDMAFLIRENRVGRKYRMAVVNEFTL